MLPCPLCIKLRHPVKEVTWVSLRPNKWRFLKTICTTIELNLQDLASYCWVSGVYEGGRVGQGHPGIHPGNRVDLGRSSGVVVGRNDGRKVGDGVAVSQPPLVRDHPPLLHCWHTDCVAGHGQMGAGNSPDAEGRMGAVYEVPEEIHLRLPHWPPLHLLGNTE